MDSLGVQSRAEQPDVCLLETINPTMLGEAWLEPPLGHVLAATSQPRAMAEPMSPSNDTIVANFEVTDMLQPCFDELLIPFNPAWGVSERYGDHNLETPSSLLENDDTSLSSTEEKLWLEWEEDASGLYSEGAGGLFFADNDASGFLSESVEMFIRSEGGDSPKEEREALLENRDGLEPDPEEISSSLPHATTIKAPGGLAELAENITARSSA
jgi:hypothetical protein